MYAIRSYYVIKIFNRFEQGKKNDDSSLQKVKGSGIGLSICKEFILLHRGKILVQSDIGKATRFTIALPTTQGAQSILLESHKEGSSLIQSEPKAISSDIKEYKKCKLLIVEDNSELRDLMFNFLTKHFQVVVATRITSYNVCYTKLLRNPTQIHNTNYYLNHQFSLRLLKTVVR